LKLCGPVYGLSLSETDARAEQLLNYLDLWSDRHTFIEQSSFGMKKKCALAMALIHNPRVLFLDEPFEGIDPVASRSIKDLLILMSKKGITILITSHILEIVERLVTAFAVIVHGEMAVSQTMEETFQSGRSLEETYFQYVERRVVEDFEWIG
jgi:ABC-2 type transport system ATP-binding protein